MQRNSLPLFKTLRSMSTSSKLTGETTHTGWTKWCGQTRTWYIANEINVFCLCAKYIKLIAPLYTCAIQILDINFAFNFKWIVGPPINIFTKILTQSKENIDFKNLLKNWGILLTKYRYLINHWNNFCK